MLKITEQNFQTKENDRFVSSFLFKQLQHQENNNYHPSSGTAAMPCPLYDGGVSVAVPFVWESKPGTPKHPSLGQSPGLPPLTPPPAYSYQQQQPSNKKPVKLKRRLKLLLLPEFWKSLPKFVLCIRGIITRKVVGGGSRSSSTVAASGRKDVNSSSTRGARTDQRPSSTPVRSKRYRMSRSSSRSKTNRVTRKSKPLAGYLASKEDDDYYEEENAAVVKESTRRSSNSNLCFSFW